MTPHAPTQVRIRILVFSGTSFLSSSTFHCAWISCPRISMYARTCVHDEKCYFAARCRTTRRNRIGGSLADPPESEREPRKTGHGPLQVRGPLFEKNWSTLPFSGRNRLTLRSLSRANFLLLYSRVPVSGLDPFRDLLRRPKRSLRGQAPRQF